MSKALVCGAGGQLGQELVLTCPEQCQAIPMTRSMLNIADPVQVAKALDDTGPSWVINAAAFTAVDAAESEPELAHRVNAMGPEILALQCRERNIRFLHVSTDFVFDGTQGHPYAPDAEPNPLGVYGRSKLDGENAVIAAGGSSVILRTGWVYSRHGGNFVKTMLRLMAEREQLSVVEDQVGTPTWARGLALTCWGLADHGDASGITIGAMLGLAAGMTLPWRFVKLHLNWACCAKRRPCCRYPHRSTRPQPSGRGTACWTRL